MRQSTPNENYMQPGQKYHSRIKPYHENKRHKNDSRNRNPIKLNLLRIVWIALFAMYLYLLTKLILFKGDRWMQGWYGTDGWRYCANRN